MKRIKSFWAWIRAQRVRMILAALVLALLAFGGYRLIASSGTKAPQYQTATVTKGTVVSSVSASGQILSTNTINIDTLASGVVTRVYVTDGQYVSAGQKIAEVQLDPEGAQKNAQALASLVSAQVSLNTANNNYRLSQATVQRVYDDLKGHATDETFTQKETRTKAEVANDNAFEAIKSAKASLSSASLAYRLVSPTVTAPYSGIVDNVALTEGMVLAAASTSTTGSTSSTRVAVIRRSGPTVSTFNLSEADVNKVHPGQKATITLDSIADKTFTGKVLTVDRIGTVASGVTSYPVVLAFDTQSDEVLPNMAATANIILDTKSDVLVVPSEAVTTTNGESTVRVLKNGQVETRTVQTGIFSDTQTEITSGLSEGEVVITGTSASTTASGSTSPFSTLRFGGGGGGGNVRVGR